MSSIGPSKATIHSGINMNFDDRYQENLRRNGDKPPKPAELDVIRMSDIQAVPVEWLWQDWVAIGKLSMLAGEGGKGKSTVLCDLAARTTRGDRWPDGAAATKPGSVIILAAEDDVADTLKPRLLAAGADVTRILNIRAARNGDQSRRSFNLQLDLERLEQEIARQGDVRLVIIDPITSYLGKVDSHKNAEVRSVIEPVGELAARVRVAILGNNHLSKGTGSANNRMIGSVAFINTARAGFIVTPDAEDENRLLFIRSKTNNGAPIPGLAYRIEGCMVTDGDQEMVTSRIAWETGPVTISADAALAAHDGDGESRTQKSEAMDFLRDMLSAGPRRAADIRSDAREIGINPKPLKSAKKALGIQSEKSGMEDGWMWAMPPKGPSIAEEAQGERQGPFEVGGPLREPEPDPDGYSFHLDGAAR